MIVRDLEFFRRMILSDETLQEQLRDLTERDQFVTRVVELGEIHNCSFSIAEVEEAMREGRRVWVQG